MAAYQQVRSRLTEDDLNHFRQSLEKTRRSLQLGPSEHELGEIQQIEAALNRVDMGTFGTCLLCGGEIAMAHLEAMPTAQICGKCQLSWQEADHI